MLMSKDARGAAKNRRVTDSAKIGQTMAALKGMCNRDKDNGALELQAPHRRAITDLIHLELDESGNGLLEDVGHSARWHECYIRELPWVPADIDESKPHAKEEIHHKLIAKLCQYSEAMKSDPSKREPKLYPKVDAKKSALDKIAENGLVIRRASDSGAAAAVGAGAASAPTTAAGAAATATAVADNMEALQRQQELLQRSIDRWSAKLGGAISPQEKGSLEKKIEKATRKQEELDDRILDLM
jgi:hypothetical protein